MNSETVNGLRWATVTASSPLKIRPDGSSSVVAAVNVASRSGSPSVGQRCLWQTVTGAAGDPHGALVLVVYLLTYNASTNRWENAAT